MLGLFKRKKIKFKHDERCMNVALGISNERAIELAKLVSLEWNRFVNSNDMRISQVLENSLRHAKNDAEVVYVSFVIGQLSENYRIGIEILSAVAENINNVETDRGIG